MGDIGGGRGPGRGGGLGDSAPRILAIPRKMTGLMAAPTFVPIGTVGSFMSTFADGALKWLSCIPHTTRVALDITLEGYVVVQ